MVRVIFGNHSSVLAPRQSRDSIRRFYCEVLDPHLYFQAPGGQCLRLTGIDEDLTFYEGAVDGPNVARIKEALGNLAQPV